MKVQYQRIIGTASKPSVKLTKGAREMIRYLCQGLTNAEIAEARSISLSAVKNRLTISTLSWVPQTGPTLFESPFRWNCTIESTENVDAIAKDKAELV